MKCAVCILGKAVVAGLLLQAATASLCVAAEAGTKSGVARPLPATAQRIEFPLEGVEHRSVENYLGAPVLSLMNNRRLGEIRDFLVDEHTSRLAFAVASSGGVFGFGDVLRLVPIGALTPVANGSRFTVNVSEEQWKKLLTVSEDDFVYHRIAVSGIDPEKHEPFERDTTATSTPVAPGSSALNQRLIRVSDLPGRNVAVGQLDVGEIEDIVLDFKAGTVRALLDPDREFAGTGDKVLVPLGKFIFAERGERLVGTLLTRSDFNDLYPSWNQTTGPRQPPAVAERHRERRQELTPTGRNAAPASSRTTADREPVVRAAESVRKRLRSDSKFEGAEVHVVPENGRLMLRGDARDDAQRQAIRQAANEAAGSVPIENEIRIKTR